MTKKRVRTYTDVNGVTRTITEIGPGFYVQWIKGKEPSTSTRWRQEDGHVIQIPDAAWELFGVSYAEEMIEVADELETEEF